MGQAKNRSKEIAMLKQFDSIVDKFVAQRNKYNRYGGGIFRANNVRRTNTGEYNKCVSNADAYVSNNNRIAPAFGWILVYNEYSNQVEIMAHMWNLDCNRDIMFDSTPFAGNIKHFAYVWDSDMFMYYNEHHAQLDRTLPGSCYYENGNFYSVIDMDPITGHVLDSKKFDTMYIHDFNWNPQYVNPYDDEVAIG
jgi:hypothetical protein